MRSGNMVSGGYVLNRKTVSISAKHQITIPNAFFTELGFDKEADLFLRDGELVVRPASRGGDDFSEKILSDLVKEGFSGDELLEEFKIRKEALRGAVSEMISDAKKGAAGKIKTYGMDDVFGG